MMATKSTTPSKPQQIQGLLRDFIAKYSGHKTSCPRLKDEVMGKAQLSDCNCGYDPALIKLDQTLRILK